MCFKIKAIEKKINKINSTNGFCSVIFKFKQKNKTHSIFVKFLGEKTFIFIEKFAINRSSFVSNLLKLDYFFVIKKIDNEKFENVIEK